MTLQIVDMFGILTAQTLILRFIFWSVTGYTISPLVEITRGLVVIYFSVRAVEVK